MIKTWFPRGILTGIIIGILYLMWQTWVQGWGVMLIQETGTYSTTLMYICLAFELSVLTAALTLLIETFIDHIVIDGNLKKWWYVLSLPNSAYDEQGNLTEGASAHICSMFFIRSYSLAILSETALMFIFVVIMCVNGILSFLLNPRLPDIDFVSLGFGILIMVASFILLVSILFWLYDRTDHLTGLVRRVTRLFFTFTISGIYMGIVIYLMALTDGSFFFNIMTYVGISWLIAGIVVFACVIGYFLYRFVRTAISRLSYRFPFLNDLWNDICPLRIVHTPQPLPPYENKSIIK